MLIWIFLFANCAAVGTSIFKTLSFKFCGIDLYSYFAASFLVSSSSYFNFSRAPLMFDVGYFEIASFTKGSNLAFNSLTLFCSIIFCSSILLKLDCSSLFVELVSFDL